MSLDLSFSKVEVKTDKQNVVEVEYSLNSNEEKPKTLFNQFIISINKSQEIKLFEKYGCKWIVNEAKNTIKQTFSHNFQLKKIEDIKQIEGKNKIISNLFEQIREFQNKGFHICYFNFQLLGYLEKENKYCFLILPYLIHQEYVQERKIDIANDIYDLVRGQLLLDQTNRKLELLCLLKNYVCSIQKQKYQYIKNKFDNSRSQLIRENIFINIIEKDGKVQNDFQFILAYPIKGNKEIQGLEIKQIYEKCEIIEENIPMHVLTQKHLLRHSFDIDTLIDYLNDQERPKIDELIRQTQINQTLKRLNQQIDNAVEKYHNETNNLNVNYDTVIALLEKQKNIYKEEYHENTFNSFKEQQDSLIRNLQEFKANIQNLQSQNQNYNIRK